MTEGAPTIVLVDDAAEVRLVVKTRLRLSGFFDVIGEAEDGAEAVELAREHQPALMLLDGSMPGVGGLSPPPPILPVAPGARGGLYNGVWGAGLVEEGP